MRYSSIGTATPRASAEHGERAPPLVRRMPRRDLRGAVRLEYEVEQRGEVGTGHDNEFGPFPLDPSRGDSPAPSGKIRENDLRSRLRDGVAQGSHNVFAAEVPVRQRD